MRIAAIVAACLVVIPACVFVWATSEPGAATPDRAVLLSRGLGGLGLHPLSCTSHDQTVTCAMKNGSHCTVTFEPGGTGNGTCTGKNGLVISLGTLTRHTGPRTIPPAAQPNT